MPPWETVIILGELQGGKQNQAKQRMINRSAEALGEIQIR